MKVNKKIFKDVENKLRKNLEKSVPIDHVGSTAIPNMCGKNIIDIVIGAKDSNDFHKINEIVESEGFVASKKSKDEIYQFFSSIAGETGSGDVHIHVVVMNTDRYSEFLILRDYLLLNKSEAKAYSNFKKEILHLGNEDRREYKRVKSEYVSSLLERAKQEYNK